MKGLCPTCVHVRVVEGANGSRFLMCKLAKEDDRFAKYPPQPVVRCAGHERAEGPEEERS